MPSVIPLHMLTLWFDWVLSAPLSKLIAINWAQSSIVNAALYSGIPESYRSWVQSYQGHPFFVKNLLDFWLYPSLFRKSRKMCVSVNKKLLSCRMTTWFPPIDSSYSKEQVYNRSRGHWTTRSPGKWQKSCFVDFQKILFFVKNLLHTWSLDV